MNGVLNSSYFPSRVIVDLWIIVIMWDKIRTQFFRDEWHQSPQYIAKHFADPFQYLGDCGVVCASLKWWRYCISCIDGGLHWGFGSYYTPTDHCRRVWVLNPRGLNSTHRVAALITPSNLVVAISVHVIGVLSDDCEVFRCAGFNLWRFCAFVLSILWWYRTSVQSEVITNDEKS